MGFLRLRIFLRDIYGPKPGFESPESFRLKSWPQPLPDQAFGTKDGFYAVWLVARHVSLMGLLSNTPMVISQNPLDVYPCMKCGTKSCPYVFVESSLSHVVTLFLLTFPTPFLTLEPGSICSSRKTMG